MRWLRIALLLGILATQCWADRTAITGVGKRMKLASPVEAPFFSVTTLDGSTMDLKMLDGKVVIMDLMSSMCRPCRILAQRVLTPWYVQLREEGKAYDDVVLLSVSIQDTIRSLQAFATTHAFVWPHAIDPSREIAVSYAAHFVPRVVVISPTGMWAYTYGPRQHGALTEEDLWDIVNTIRHDFPIAAPVVVIKEEIIKKNTTLSPLEQRKRDEKEKERQILAEEAETVLARRNRSNTRSIQRPRWKSTIPEWTQVGFGYERGTKKDKTLPEISLKDREIWTFAIVAGVMMFFSPCSFPLLGGYISFYLTQRPKNAVHPMMLHAPSSRKNWWSAGMATALGLWTALLLIGLLALPFGPLLSGIVGWLEPVIAASVVLAGCTILFNWDAGALLVPFQKVSQQVQRWWRKMRREGKKARNEKEDGRNLWHMFWFGVGYGISSAGCNLPVVLSLVLLCFRQSVGFAAITVLLYACSSALLMIVFTAMVALLGKRVKSAHRVRQLGGVGMILVGANMLRKWFMDI